MENLFIDCSYDEQKCIYVDHILLAEFIYRYRCGSHTISFYEEIFSNMDILHDLKIYYKLTKPYSDCIKVIFYLPDNISIFHIIIYRLKDKYFLIKDNQNSLQLCDGIFGLFNAAIKIINDNARFSE